jgi:hypothetical protein
MNISIFYLRKYKVLTNINYIYMSNYQKLRTIKPDYLFKNSIKISETMLEKYIPEKGIVKIIKLYAKPQNKDRDNYVDLLLRRTRIQFI